MTEKHARQTEKKKKIRIDYVKAARALALLILVLTIVFSYMPAAFGKGIMNYDRDLIRPSGELGSKAPGIRAETAIMYSLDLDIQLSFATRMEDWTCLGQHKRQPEFPVVTRESRRNS